MSRTVSDAVEDSMSLAPLPQATVAPLVAPHLPRLGQVLVEAWDDFTVSRDAPAGPASARKCDVHNCQATFDAQRA